jgi:cytoskeletal protein RodZ
MAEVNSESVGEYLRSVREKKRCTLEQAAEATKIKAENLEAIEADRITDRVPLVYAKAFVKSYAEFLGEDGAEIVARFKRRHGDASAVVSPFPITPVMRTKGALLKKPFSDWRILAGAGVVGVLILYLLLGALFSQPCKVTVRATDRVLVKVYQESRFVSGVTLPAGAEKTWKAKRSVRLTISKAENVSVLHKGRKVAIPKTGSVTVTVTSRGVTVTRPS